jgi:opacity protein-like surface antigen
VPVREPVKIILFVLLCAIAGYGQVPSGNVFFGYSYLRGNIFSQNVLLQPPSRAANFNGWEVSLDGKFLPFIGIVADVGQTYGSQTFTFCGPAPACVTGQRIDSRVLTGLVGVRGSFSVKRFTPFAHALFGGAHISDSHATSNSDTSFATAIGGGLDYKFVKGVAWRFQGDELHTSFFGGGQNNFRFSTGLVLRF